MLLPTREFARKDDLEDTQDEQDDLRKDVEHIKGKVDMLNDWHNTVNVSLAELKTNQTWVLRIAIVLGALALADKVPNVLSALTLISKLLGG